MAEKKRRGERETVALLQEAALHLFSLKGYHGTGMRDIAEEAGVAVGLSYNYFASKAELLASLIESHVERVRSEGQRNELFAKPITDLTPVILGFVNLEGRTIRLVWSMLLHPATRAEIPPRTLERLREAEQAIDQMFAAFFQGRRKAPDPALLRTVILGIVIQHLADPATMDESEIRRILGCLF